MKYKYRVLRERVEILESQKEIMGDEFDENENVDDFDFDDLEEDVEGVEFRVKMNDEHKEERRRRKKVDVDDSESDDTDEDSSDAQAFDVNTVIDIITGIRASILDPKHDDHDTLVPTDFTYSPQYTHKEKRGTHTKLKFKVHAPKVMAQLRKFYGVSDESYLESFKVKNMVSVLGEGKSGAFFIFTKDSQFIVKTALGEERDFLWRILPDYYQHVYTNEDTFLPRFYGIYSMKHEGIGGVTRFVVMQNNFCTPYSPVEKYDLKGSSVGRKVAEKKRKPGCILKDLDIKGERNIWIPNDLKQKFVEQLRIDTQFLSDHKVMDYSLLLGIYYETEDNQESTESNIKRFENYRTWQDMRESVWMRDSGGLKVFNEDAQREEILYIGIIDILIKYQAKKKMEHMFKSVAYDPKEFSVVPPNFYAERFVNFMEELLPEEIVKMDASVIAEKRVTIKQTRKKDVYSTDSPRNTLRH